MSDITSLTSLEKRAISSLAVLYGFRMLGLFMVLPVLAIYAPGYKGFTPLLLGVAIGVYGLTQAILQVPLGLVSDRIGRKPVVIGGLLVFVLGSLIAALSHSMAGLITGRALQGGGAIASTLMALVSDLTSEENRAKAMAAIGGTIGLSFMLAMVVGPVIASTTGLPGIFWFTAGLGAAGILFFMAFVPQVVRVQNRETLADTSEIRNLLRDTNLLRLDFGIFVLHLVLMAGFVVIPTLLMQELGFHRENLWWVYMGLLGGGFFAMLPLLIIGEKRRVQKQSFIIAVAVMAGAALLLGLHRSFALTLLLLLLYFAAFNMLEASLPSWLSKSCPAGQRGTAMGIYSTSQFFGAFCGGVLGGWSLQQFGTDGLFLMIAAILAIWLLVSLGLRQPRPMKTVVLRVGDMHHAEFAELISAIPGVEDILVVEGEPLAYAKIDQQRAEMQRLKPYFNT